MPDPDPQLTREALQGYTDRYLTNLANAVVPHILTAAQLRTVPPPDLRTADAKERDDIAALTARVDMLNAALDGIVAELRSLSAQMAAR
jgi:outer membrane protein TolC